MIALRRSPSLSLLDFETAKKCSSRNGTQYLCAFDFLELWELILADNAEAVFIVARRWKTRERSASYYLMQPIHHVVVPTFES